MKDKRLNYFSYTYLYTEHRDEVKEDILYRFICKELKEVYWLGDTRAAGKSLPIEYLDNLDKVISGLKLVSIEDSEKFKKYYLYELNDKKMVVIEDSGYKTYMGNAAMAKELQIWNKLIL